MGKTAFLFPGQGAQCADMGVDLMLVSPAVADLFEEAKQYVGVDIFDLCKGPYADLIQPQNLQPSLVTVGLAVATMLRERGIEPDCVAGYMEGEYTAHIVANTLDPETAFQLVSRRGSMMAMASRGKDGGMAVFENCDLHAASQLCKEFGEDAGRVLAPASLDCPGQITLSGTNEAVAAACEKWREQGNECRVLDAVGAYNTSMMDMAVRMMKMAFKGTAFAPPQIPLYCNSTGLPLNVKNVDEALTKQINSTVLWEDTIRNMIADGVDRFFECGPSKMLADTVRLTAEEMGADVQIISLGSKADFEASGL